MTRALLLAMFATAFSACSPDLDRTLCIKQRQEGLGIR